MRDAQVGLALKTLRRRGRLTQEGLAAATGVSQSMISRLERGLLDGATLGTLRRAFQPLDATVSSVVWWRAGELDRLIDEAHAVLVGATIDRLERAGWQILPEVTLSEYGERGSIDVLAVRRDLGVALTVEVKSVLFSLEEMLRRLDVKARLCRRIVSGRVGWTPRAVWRLLVLPDASTARRRVERHDSVLGRALPDRGVPLREALRDPSRAQRPVAGICFLSIPSPVASKRRPVTARRVRTPQRPSVRLRVTR